jgi:hypothetical protein
MQQDGAPDHFGGTDFLSRHFPERWIGRGGPVAWPARSPDLTLMYCFLWGHVQSLVYAKRSNSTVELINRIMDAADRIRNDQMMRALMSIVERAQMCVDNQGGHFENTHRT